MWAKFDCFTSYELITNEMNWLWIMYTHTNGSYKKFSINTRNNSCGKCFKCLRYTTSKSVITARSTVEIRPSRWFFIATFCDQIIALGKLWWWMTFIRQKKSFAEVCNLLLTCLTDDMSVFINEENCFENSWYNHFHYTL